MLQQNLFNKKLIKWIGLLSIMALLFIAVVPSAAAQQFMGDNEVIIAEGEVVADDLIVGSERFVLNGTVEGDLIVAGSDIEINGTVEGDLMAAGQSVTINGRIADDVRIAGAALTLGPKARVMDDVLALGYSLENRAGSLVNGNLFFAGAQSRLAGHVSNNVHVEAGGLELLGSVGGNVTAIVDDAANAPAISPYAFTPNAPAIPTFPWGLTMGENASIGGDFDYSAPTEYSIPIGTVIGEISSQLVTVEETAVNIPPAPFTGPWLLDQFRNFVGILAVGMLLVWSFPVYHDQVSGIISQRPWASLGWGLIALPAFAVAFLAIIAVMILLGMLFGALTLDGLVTTTVFLGLFAIFALALFFGLTLAYFAKIIVALIGGRLLLGWISPAAAESRIGSLLVGLLLIAILTAIPFVGGWINFAVILLGLGALWLGGLDWLQQRQSTPKRAATTKPTLQPA